MRILRFNESKIYWDKNKISSLTKDYDELLILLEEYLKFKLGKDTEFSVNDFFFDEDNTFVINYSTEHDFENSYYALNFEYLLNFINNIEQYKNEQKYNL